jgi:hypothetical protein
MFTKDENALVKDCVGMGLLVCLKGPPVSHDGVMFVGGLVVDQRALLGPEAGELEDPFSLHLCLPSHRAHKLPDRLG